MVARTECVRTMKFLEYDMLPEAGTELMKGVCRNSSLELLWLIYNALRFGGACILGEYLSTSSKLRDLSLCHVSRFDEVQLVLIVEGLKTNRSLETLKIQYGHITTTGIDRLTEVLKSNSTLKSLVVSVYGLAQAAARSLGIFLEFNSTLLHVNLRDNDIDESEAMWLATSLKFNTHLETLNLEANYITSSLCFDSPIRIDNSTARRFAHLLIKTKTLKHIQINDCKARKGALEIVVKGLKVNQSVSHMEMDFSATHRCTNAFVDMLKGNKTLTYFGHITTKKSELRFIAEELRAHRVLTSLKIWEQPEYDEDISEINKILRRNVSYFNRAVEFALDSEKFGIDRQPAEIFEKVCDTQTYQNHLSRVAGPERAYEAMRYARRHITTNLFVIAGVSEVPVTCWPYQEGAPQIHSLNIWCWMHMFYI
ncbi:hypothetical protein MRX96_014247 [Rhipicephalus microplus]